MDLFLTLSTKRTHCNVLCLLALVCRVSAVMGGKGGGRKGRYQGKASKLEKREEAETILREFVLQDQQKAN